MRLFTAIELPDPVRAHLVTVRDRLVESLGSPGAVSWVKPENVHITLKFLGEVPDAAVGKLVDALAGVAVRPMRLVADHMVFFPKRGPVRVIAAGLVGDVEELRRLNAGIEEACAGLGFPREGRAYTPHATIGRVRPTPRKGDLIAVRDVPLDGAFPGPNFSAGGFVLMRSELNPKGAIYTPAARFPRKTGT